MVNFPSKMFFFVIIGRRTNFCTIRITTARAISIKKNGKQTFFICPIPNFVCGKEQSKTKENCPLWWTNDFNFFFVLLYPREETNYIAEMVVAKIVLFDDKHVQCYVFSLQCCMMFSTMSQFFLPVCVFHFEFQFFSFVYKRTKKSKNLVAGTMFSYLFIIIYTYCMS